MIQTGKITEEIQPCAGLTLTVPDMARILIVGDDDSDTERLKTAFREGGLTSESANSITAGCEAAKSGRFQVVFSPPLLADGSWRRLIDVAQHYDLSFELVLLARSFNLGEWAEAIQEGAFDVLDVLHDLPKAAEAAKRALGMAYLKRFRSRPERVCVSRGFGFVELAEGEDVQRAIAGLNGQALEGRTLTVKRLALSARASQGRATADTTTAVDSIADRTTRSR